MANNIGQFGWIDQNKTIYGSSRGMCGALKGACGYDNFLV